MAKGNTNAKAPAKPMTPTKGKSAAKNTSPAMPAYKPSMWFDGKGIPKGMENCKPGDTVTITAQAKVIRKSEGLNSMDKSMSVELEKMAVNTPTKK